MSGNAYSTGNAHSTVRIKVEDGVEPSANRVPQQQPEIRHQTAPFFGEHESLATANEFFGQACLRLLRNCGYEARPSKQKPTKISVRCEQHATDSCPFRLCAFLDSGGSGRWRISSSNTPVEEPVTNPRLAILYDETDRFRDIDAFFARTRTLSLEMYDVKCSPHHHTSDAAVSSCLLRLVCRCPYRVRAKRSGAGFVVDFDRTNWEHNHERGSRVAVAPGIPEKSRRLRLERSDGDSANEDSALGEAASEEEDEAVATEDEHDASGGGGRSKKLAIVPPNAPKVGDCFDSLGEGYAAFAVANLTSLGVSVFRSGPPEALHGSLYCNRRSYAQGCPFKANFGPSRKDGTRCAVLPSSVLYHAHDTRPELLADPSWRPTIRCQIVRAALAKLERGQQKTSTRSLTSRVADLPPPPVPKRPRLSEPAPSLSSTAATTSASPLFPAQSRSSYTTIPPQSRQSLPTPSMRSNGIATTPATQLSRASSLAVPSSGGDLKPPPATARPGQQPEDAFTRAKVAFVSSFLAGLDVTLVPLAKHLVDAGINSFDALTHLITLSPGPLQALLSQLQKRVVLTDPACPSPLGLLRVLPNAKA
ncbi:hypothetical protein JCM10908_000819 [Rhodotorula pacifica]|uniref:uncharacterized protein n=1 Tax=Rhodotorula pacifica TaxID=1495444 RepID=UPI003170C78E